ncbi:MAG: hypothetical protein GY719_03845 [bacterium]|nr:hypothetical protein [bacterium]
MVESIKRFFSYLVGKKSEISDLDAKDIMLTKVVLDIHRKRTHKELTTVPLFSIRQVHRLDRESSELATQQRVKTLEAHKQDLLVVREMTCDRLAEYLPSISWMKVVEHEPGGYIAFEGNGRLAAMQEVFSPDDGMTVEVEQYHFRNTPKIVRRLNRVRRMNSMGRGFRPAR